MRTLLYSLLFLGTVLLVLDLVFEIDKIEPPKKLPTTHPVLLNTPDTLHSASHPDIKKTLKLYTEAIAKSPNTAKPYLDRANAYIENREYNKALADFNQALQIEPKNTDFLLQKGLVFLRLEKPDDAVRCFSQTLAISPNLKKALIYRGITNFSRNLYQPALDDFLTLLKNDPKFVDLHLSIAQCYHGLNNQLKAEENLSLYLKLSTDPKAKEKANSLHKEWAKKTDKQQNPPPVPPH